MLIVISPAKTLNFENARIIKQESFPEYANKAEELVKILKRYKPVELVQLMHISEKLATLNADRFKHWQKVPDKALVRQAVCAFNGEVYTGLNVGDWDDNDFEFSQQHLRILSGLYGVLRPLDYICPYRLEMGIKLPTRKGATLYDFWGDLLTKNINTQLAAQGDSILINLASNEYFKALNTKKLKVEIITPVFLDAKNGEYSMISFFAKKARGMMSCYIIKNRLTQSEQLKEFNLGGYYFNHRLTKDKQWVFTRD